MSNNSKDTEKSLELFLKIGLDERTAKNTIANNKVTANLTAVIHEAGVTDGCNRTVGNLMYSVATKYPANALVHRPVLLNYVVTSKVRPPAQLEAAFSFLGTTGPDNFKINEFEEACGVALCTHKRLQSIFMKPRTMRSQQSTSCAKSRLRSNRRNRDGKNILSNLL